MLLGAVAFGEALNIPPLLRCNHNAMRRKKMAKNRTFVLHDESVNTYGFRMLTSGANLEEFIKNPVMLFNHDSWALPIGYWENIRIEGTQILADAVFDLNDPRGKEIADKVEGGFIRMASIGAWEPEEVSDAPELMYPGQRGNTVTRWTVREASIVAIGANHNAIALFDRKTGNGINLSDQTTLLSLLDKASKEATPQPTKKEQTMSKLRWLLGLSDNASTDDETKAVEQLQAKVEELEAENKELKAEVAELEKKIKELEDADKVAKDEEKKKEQEEAKELIDAAVRDGRIDATAREAYVTLFDRDFSAAKIALSALPKRQPVSSRIGGGVTLGDGGSAWSQTMAQARENFNK